MNEECYPRHLPPFEIPVLTMDGYLVKDGDEVYYVYESPRDNWKDMFWTYQKGIVGEITVPIGCCYKYLPSLCNAFHWPVPGWTQERLADRYDDARDRRLEDIEQKIAKRETPTLDDARFLLQELRYEEAESHRRWEAEMDAEREKYRKAHRYCPQCGCVSHESTTLGYFGKDMNRSSCSSCSWVGPVDRRTEKPVKRCSCEACLMDALNDEEVWKEFAESFISTIMRRYGR